MMIDACAPASFWGEAVIAAGHIHNVSTVRDGKIAEQAFLKSTRPVDLTYLHPWGCDAVVHHTPTEPLAKFEARAELMTFVGYEPSSGWEFMRAVRVFPTNRTP